MADDNLWPVACIQLNSSDDIDANAARIGELTRQAKADGAKFIALPETAWQMEPLDPDYQRTLYTEGQHPAVAYATELAQELGVWFLAGSIAVKGEGSDKTYNRALLFNPQGAIAARYDKIHLFDVALDKKEQYNESHRFLAGDKAVYTQCADAVLGLSICYDVRFAALYRTLAQAGAQIITVPAAFTVPTGQAHWHTLLRSRAIETGCYVIAPTQVGEHPGKRFTYGHSLIIDPWGKIIAEADGKEPRIIAATLDLNLVAATRKRVPSLSLEAKFTAEKQ